MFVCVTSKFGYAGYFRGRYVSKLYQSLDEQSFSIFIDFKLLVYYIAVYYKVTPESEWVVFCFPIYSISQRTEMQVSTWLFSCLVQTVLKVTARWASVGTSSRSGCPCPFQNCSQWPPAENTGRGSLLNFSSCTPWWPSQSRNWTELSQS